MRYVTVLLGIVLVGTGVRAEEVSAPHEVEWAQLRPPGASPQYPGYPQLGSPQGSPQAAQPRANALVGVWSAPLQVRRSMVWWSFGPDGRCQQRFIVPAGTGDYFCRYQSTPDGTYVQVVFDGYAPRTVPPVVQLHTPVTLQLQWHSPNMFFMADASGPLRFVRQR